MDKEERILIEDLMDKLIDSKEEAVRAELEEDEKFNPVMQPWKSGFGNAGPSSKTLRHLIYPIKEE